MELDFEWDWNWILSGNGWFLAESWYSWVVTPYTTTYIEIFLYLILFRSFVCVGFVAVAFVVFVLFFFYRLVLSAVTTAGRQKDRSLYTLTFYQGQGHTAAQKTHRKTQRQREIHT